jgi:hypothetical protein
LLRVSTTRLENVGEALLHRGVELGDGSVDVRHDFPPCMSVANKRTSEASTLLMLPRVDLLLVMNMNG